MKELEQQEGTRVDFKEIDISKDFTEADRYDIQGTPTVVVLDRAGNVSATMVGARGKAEVQAALDKALAAP